MRHKNIHSFIWGPAWGLNLGGPHITQTPVEMFAFFLFCHSLECHAKTGVIGNPPSPIFSTPVKLWYRVPNNLRIYGIPRHPPRLILYPAVAEDVCYQKWSAVPILAAIKMVYRTVHALLVAKYGPLLRNRQCLVC